MMPGLTVIAWRATVVLALAILGVTALAHVASESHRREAAARQAAGLELQP